MEGQRLEVRQSFWDRPWVGTTGFVLALIAGFAVPLAVIVLSFAASPYTDKAIDPYDDNILAPSERATLSSIGAAMGAILLAGTIVGVLALTIGAATTETNKRAGTTVLLAVIAPIVCVFFAFWTLSAAGSPDVIEGSPHPVSSVTTQAG